MTTIKSYNPESYTITFEPPKEGLTDITTEGEYYTQCNSDFTGTYSIDTTTISPTYTATSVNIDPWSGYADREFVNKNIIDSNPTCKALWEQFSYVYEMVKRDWEEDEKNNGTISF